MIGNDIIDLQLAKLQSDWRRPRFIQKIYTQSEQNFIANSENPELEIWKLWSRKEAVYKIYNRETGIKGYFPWKLECSTALDLSNKDEEFVEINNEKYFTQTCFDRDQVYTVAVKYLELFKKISEVSSHSKIIKIKGLPYLENTLQPVSITHHGRFEKKIRLLDF